jgi:hypothetical protein
MITSNHPIRALICLIALSLCGAANAGLIHRYSFKDATVKDSVGKVDATLKGDAKIVLSNTGKTSDDAKLSYLQFNSPVIPKSGSVSLIIWVTAKENPPFCRVLDIGDSDSGSGQAFIYLVQRHDDDVSKAAVTASDTGSKTFMDGKRLDDGKPHMAAIVIDGTAKKLHYFVDGVESPDPADLGDNTLDKVNPTHSWIGRSGFDADPGLSAEISEFRVYDQALGAAEIAAIQNAGPDVLPSQTPASGGK